MSENLYDSHGFDEYGEDDIAEMIESLRSFSDSVSSDSVRVGHRFGYDVGCEKVSVSELVGDGEFDKSFYCLVRDLVQLMDFFVREESSQGRCLKRVHRDLLVLGNEFRVANVVRLFEAGVVSREFLVDCLKSVYDFEDGDFL